MPIKIPTYITQEEFEKILEEVPKRLKPAKAKKYKLALLLGFEAGLRISEIIGLPKEYSKCCKVPITKKKELDVNKNKKYTNYLCSQCGKVLTTTEKYRPNNI